MNTVAENLNEIQKSISRFAHHPVSIVTVTKKQPIERIQEAVRAGIGMLGINYTKEGLVLQKTLGIPVAWHFIGHIQSKKIKFLVDYQCIQSLDRPKIAESLEESLRILHRKIPVLIEINIGNEPQKSGIQAASLGSFLKMVVNSSHLEIKGLMAMPPPVVPVESRRVFFKAMRSLYQKFQKEFGFEWLSMGTSEDLVIALQEGSNMVRLGSCLLGERPMIAT